MIRLVLLLLCAVPLAAQPTITQVFARSNQSNTVEDASLQLGVTMSASTATFQFRVSYTESLNDTNCTGITLSRQSIEARDAFADISTLRRVGIADLQPGSKVCVSFEVSATDGETWSSAWTCPTTCTDCSSGDNSVFQDLAGPGHSNLQCPVSGEQPFVQLAAADDPAPALPVDPVITFSPVAPEPAASYEVDGTCSDLESVYDTAETAAEGDGSVRRIVLPAGVRCAPWQIRVIANGGRVQFACSTIGTNLLPPPGSQPDPSVYPYMCPVGPDPDTPSTWLAAGWLTAATNANDHDFMGILWTAPDVDDITPVVMNVSGVNTSTEVITVDDTSLIASGNLVYVDLTGTGITGAHSHYVACSVTDSPDTLVLRFVGTTANRCAGGLVDLSGTYGSGGKIMVSPAIPITSWGDCGDGTQCGTSTGHGLANFPSVTINGNSSATVVTTATDPALALIVNNTAVWITDSADDSCNGLWQVIGTASNSVTMTGPDCDDASDGTMRRVDAVSVWGTNDPDLGRGKKSKTLFVVVEDANTLRFPEVSVQSGASGGYVTWESELFIGILRIGDVNASNLLFDRAGINVPFPWHLSGAGGSLVNMVRMTDSAFRDFYIDAEMSWARIHPLTGLVAGRRAPDTASNGFYIHGADGIEFLNGTCRGCSFFVDTTTSQTADIHWQGVKQFTPSWMAPGTPTSDNLDRAPPSYAVELKNCARCKFDGHRLDGGQSDFAANAAVIALANIGPQDVDFQFINSGIHNSSGGIILSSFQRDNGWRNISAKKSISIQNNIITDLDTGYCWDAGNCQSGTFLHILDRIEGLVVKNNLHHFQRGNYGLAVRLSQIGQRHIITKNVFVASEGSTSTRLGFFDFNPGDDETIGIPTPTNASGISGFNDRARSGGSLDSVSAADDNYWIPGLHNSPARTYATDVLSLTDTVTILKDDLESRAQTDGVDAGGTAGGGGSGDSVDSMQQRLDSVLETSTWTPKAGISGYGPDTAAVAAAQGFMTQPVTVLASRTTATISWTPSGSENCTVDIAAVADGYFDADNEITRQADDGGDSEQFTGLTPATEYYYRIWCKERIDGRFSTR